jgi:hypothetical protein
MSNFRQSITVVTSRLRLRSAIASLFLVISLIAYARNTAAQPLVKDQPGITAKQCGGSVEVYVHAKCESCAPYKECAPKNPNGSDKTSFELERDGGTCEWTYTPPSGFKDCSIKMKVVYFKTVGSRWVHPNNESISPCMKNKSNVVPCLVQNSCKDVGGSLPRIPEQLEKIAENCCSDCQSNPCLCGCVKWLKNYSDPSSNGYSCSRRDHYDKEKVNVSALPTCKCSEGCKFDFNLCKAGTFKAECVKLKCTTNKTGGTSCTEEKVCDGEAADGTPCCEMNAAACPNQSECLPKTCRGDEICTPDGCYSSGCSNDPGKCCGYKKCAQHPAYLGVVQDACDLLTPEEKNQVKECAPGLQ